MFSLPLQCALLSGFVSRAGPIQKTAGLSGQLGEVPTILEGTPQLWIKRERPGTGKSWTQISQDSGRWCLVCRIPGLLHTEMAVLLHVVRLTAGDSGNVMFKTF